MPCRFVGCVVDEEGHPVASARVAVLPPRDVLWLAGLSALAVPEPALLHLTFVPVDASGCFDVTRELPRVRELHGSDDPFQFGLGEFDPHLVVSAPGLLLRVVGGEFWEGETLTLGDVVMCRASVVTGRVLDEQGAPRAGVPIGIDGRKDNPWTWQGDWLLDDLTQPFDGVTDEQGRFESVGLWDGQVSIRATDDRQEQGRLEGLALAHVPAGGTADVGELILRPASESPPTVEVSVDRPPSTATVRGRSTIRGHAHDPSGAPMAGSWVEVSAAEGRYPAQLRYVRCDRQGAFVVRDWPPGNWKLRVRPGGFLDVQLADLETRDVDIEVLDYPIVRGHVTAFGKPLAGAEIHNMREQPGDIIPADGSYEFHLPDPPSSDTICLHPPDVASRFWVIQATHWGEVITFDIDLGSTSVAGRVLDARSGLPMGDVSVAIHGTDPAWWGSSTRTADDGTWFIGPVPPDRYRIEFHAGSYRDAELNIDMCDGRAVEGLDVALSPRR